MILLLEMYLWCLAGALCYDWECRMGITLNSVDEYPKTDEWVFMVTENWILYIPIQIGIFNVKGL